MDLEVGIGPLLALREVDAPGFVLLAALLEAWSNSSPSQVSRAQGEMEAAVLRAKGQAQARLAMAEAEAEA